MKYEQQRSALTAALQSSRKLIDGRLTALLFCVALAPREEQPFAANRRGSGLSHMADFCTARREQQFWAQTYLMLNRPRKLANLLVGNIENLLDHKGMCEAKPVNINLHTIVLRKSNAVLSPIAKAPSMRPGLRSETSLTANCTRPSRYFSLRVFEPTSG